MRSPLHIPRLTAPSACRFERSPAGLRNRAFTLVELLVVIGIIVILMVLIAPAMNALKGANDMDRAASDLTNMLQFCRSYAIANNTYVYLGIGEFDAAQSASATVQTLGTGRVAMVGIASKDGTRGYSPYDAKISDIKTEWDGKYTNTPANVARDFIAITKLQRYENLHILDYGQAPPSSGNMARENLTTYYRIGNAATDSVTPIIYPLGSSPTYTFKKTIQFDPDGMLRVFGSGAPTGNPGTTTYFSPQGVPQWMEIALIQTHGNSVKSSAALFPTSQSQNTGNHVCMQIDGVKATVRTFRP